MSDGDKSIHEVEMRWIKSKDQWHLLLAEGGIFLQEFYDCSKIHEFFKGLDKDKVNQYTVSIDKWR